jgi:coenzyme F420-reducing hydrogenase gamma subunit
MKKSLAIFSLTSCEGCQFEMLNHFEQFGELLNFYDLKNFRLGQEDNTMGPFDVSIIEGSPEGEEQKKFLQKVRKESKVLIAIGACAHLGGIQSERNRFTVNFSGHGDVKSAVETVRFDYIVPGCPISHSELYQALMDIYWGKTFTLPDLAVCFECRQNQNECLIKQGKPCLGPITRGGCNSVCVNAGEACLGCRGTKPEPNIDKLKKILKPIITDHEIDNMLTIYGKLENK